MASANGISGTAVFAVLGGSILAYSGLRGKHISVVVRDFLSGKNPANSPTDIPIGPSDYSTTPLAASGMTSIPSVVNAGSAAANQKTIANFLKSKGASPSTIAAWLGNIQIESGFNPANVNASEGAIGLVQWEGGRRAALQAFARVRGTSESDLGTQLAFLWQEYSSPDYASLRSQLAATNDPAQAASLIDQYYERSSGAARGQRMTAAQQFYMLLHSWGIA
jgi:hypothetical protein